jgi:ankyrin repeat protein
MSDGSMSPASEPEESQIIERNVHFQPPNLQMEKLANIDPSSKDKAAENTETENNMNNSQIIEELKDAFIKYKNSTNRKEIIAALIENEDIAELLRELIRLNQEDIVIYIIEKLTFKLKDKDEESKEENLKQLYNELFFTSLTKGRNKIVEYFIKNQYIHLPDAKDEEGNTGLIIATIHSNIQMAKLMLYYNIDILETKNKQNIDALTISVYNSDNLMFFLLANNLTYTVLNWNELCKLAIRNENLEILEYITTKYFEDKLILHHACAQKSIEVFNHILSITKEYNFKDQNGETPLHWAVMRGTFHIVDAIIKCYKQNDIDLDERSNQGLTAFHLAIIKQDKNICDLLYDSGVDVNILDNQGNSVVHLISAIGDLKWLKYIVKHYNVNSYQKNGNGNTPFVVAILNERINIVTYFIEKIPNLNWKNKQGQTALHAAVFASQFEIIEMLLTHKADISVKDMNNLTPYHYAYMEKKTEIIKLIHTLMNVDKFSLK